MGTRGSTPPVLYENIRPEGGGSTLLAARNIVSSRRAPHLLPRPHEIALHTHHARHVQHLVLLQPCDTARTHELLAVAYWQADASQAVDGTLIAVSGAETIR